MKNIKSKVLGMVGIMALSMVQSSAYATTGIAQGTVRIREGASTSSEAISVASDGEKVEILSEEDGWYKVKFEDVTGYMSKEYVKVEDTSSNTATNTSSNTTSNELSNASTNTTSNESSNTSTNTTSNESSNTSSGDEQSENVDNSVTTGNDDNTNINVEVGTQVELKMEVSLRSVPSFSSRETTNIAKGTQVTIEDKLNNWVKITDNNVSGWVLGIKVSSEDAVTSKPEDTTTSTPENPSKPEETSKPDDVSKPDDSTEPKTPVEENTPSTSEQTPESSTSTETPETTPEIETPSENTSESNKKGVINVDSARIRKSPDGEIIDVADMNDNVEIISEEGEWYKVNIEGHESGYIAKRLVTIKN